MKVEKTFKVTIILSILKKFFDKNLLKDAVNSSNSMLTNFVKLENYSFKLKLASNIVSLIDPHES